MLRNVAHWSPVGNHTLAGHSLSIGPILNITTDLAFFLYMSIPYYISLGILLYFQTGFVLLKFTL